MANNTNQQSDHISDDNARDFAKERAEFQEMIDSQSNAFREYTSRKIKTEYSPA